MKNIKNITPIEAIVFEDNGERLLLMKDMSVLLFTDGSEYEKEIICTIHYVTADEIAYLDGEHIISIYWEYIEEIKVIEKDSSESLYSLLDEFEFTGEGFAEFCQELSRRGFNAEESQRLYEKYKQKRQPVKRGYPSFTEEALLKIEKLRSDNYAHDNGKIIFDFEQKKFHLLSETNCSEGEVNLVKELNAIIDEYGVEIKYRVK